MEKAGGVEGARGARPQTDRLITPVSLDFLELTLAACQRAEGISIQLAMVGD